MSAHLILSALPAAGNNNRINDQGERVERRNEAQRNEEVDDTETSGAL